MTPADMRFRTLAELVSAILAAWALSWSLDAADPFRGTFGVLPLVVAALRAIERHSVELHSVERRRESWLSALTLGGWVLITIYRQRLGLVATDWFLAAGFLLLLTQRVATLVIRLRPSLGRSLPRRPPIAFFVLPLVVYLAIQPWSSSHRQPDGDEPYYLLVAHSLAYDFDVDLSNNYQDDWQRFMKRRIEPQPGDPVGDDGEIYSRHGFLLPLILTPAYRLAGPAGAMWVMAALAAALAWMVLRLAHHYVPQSPAGALLAYGVVAFSPPLLLYSYQIWVEIPAALLLSLALDRILLLRQLDRPRPLQLAMLALPILLLPILKMRFGLLVGPLVLIAAWRTRKISIGWVGGALATMAAGLMAFNALRFGNPLRIYSWSELDLLQYSLADFARGGFGMFYDCAFGLFPNAPIWFLLLPAFGLLIHRRASLASSPSLLFDLLLISGPYLLFIAPRIEWFGGWAPPFRYPLVFLPLVAVALAPILDQRRRPEVRALIAALAALTLVLTVVWVVIPGWTYNFADGRSHLLDQAGERLSTDIARFFPSTVRPRAATWLWIAVSLLAIPLGARWSGGWQGRRGTRRGRPAAAWGVTAVLLLLPALVFFSHRLPTGVVHFEDAFVFQPRGSVFPPPWVLQRPNYTGGWTLPAGRWLAAPITTGGEQVTIQLFALPKKSNRPARIWVGAGDHQLAILDAQQTANQEWVTTTLGPVDWPSGQPLVVRTLEGSLILDRAELTW